MYYIFSADIKAWKRKYLLAVCEPDYYSCEPFWMWAEPLVKKPERFKFIIWGDAPKPDNYSCHLEMYSKKLIDLISSFGIRFEKIAGDVYDEKTGNKLDVEYYAFHLLEKYDVIDFDKSDVEFEEDNHDLIAYIYKLYLKEDIYKNVKMMFRVKRFESFVLVHENMKKAFEENGITGMHFIPVEEYSRPRF